ncbi:F390 synthetase-related protein [Deinococcus aquaedulcis]|uniref:F390 synthetase-related protein n=1 Tax=Deinococcus aquaedulcis TaxID=2840455 RepID=UPI001C83546D|nr:F390 synthetase-related protein [Deinococcus aquaedulcis]
MKALPILHAALDDARLTFRSRPALEAHQRRLAHEHLRWVAAHSPAVAARFRAAGLPLSRWPELPPTTKAQMLATFDTLNTAGVTLAQALNTARRAEQTRDFTPRLPTPRGPVTVGLSTGTSGTQGVFLVGEAEQARWAGTVLRALLPGGWRGLTRRHRVAFFLRADSPLYRSVGSRWLDFRFFDLLRPVAELARELTAYRPTLIVGPPAVLRAVQDQGAGVQAERVVSVAEVLDPDDAGHLRAWGPVVQVYQATEGLLALPCEHGELHLTEAHVHFDLEAVGGGLVRPVITDLRRRVQPFVRHRLDDLLRLHPEPCPCGRAARRVAAIVGRQDDALHLPGPGGAPVTIWPDFLRGALSAVPGLRDYRAEQTGAATLTLALDPCTPDLGTQALAEVRAALRRSGADPAQVTLSTVPLLPLPPGTKRRRVSRARPLAPEVTP